MPKIWSVGLWLTTKLSIKKQLKVGIRFLDIRLQLVNDELVVVHSFVDQDLTFKYVLNLPLKLRSLLSSTFALLLIANILLLGSTLKISSIIASDICNLVIVKNNLNVNI